MRLIRRLALTHPPKDVRLLLVPDWTLLPDPAQRAIRAERAFSTISQHYTGHNFLVVSPPSQGPNADSIGQFLAYRLPGGHTTHHCDVDEVFTNRRRIGRLLSATRQSGLVLATTNEDSIEAMVGMAGVPQKYKHGSLHLFRAILHRDRVRKIEFTKHY